MSRKPIRLIWPVLALCLGIFALSGCNANKEADEAAQAAADQYAVRLEKLLPKDGDVGNDREAALTSLDELTAFSDELEENKEDFRLSDGSYAGYEDMSKDAKEGISALRDWFASDYKATFDENSVADLGASEVTEDKLTATTAALASLSQLVTSEAEHPVWESPEDMEAFLADVQAEADRQTARIEEMRAEREQREAEAAAAATHYANAHFSIDVPAEWGSDWTIREEDTSTPSIACTTYYLSYNGGGATVVAVDMTDTSVPLGTYRTLVGNLPNSAGTASDGWEIFYGEAGAGFFSQGATITPL